MREPIIEAPETYARVWVGKIVSLSICVALAAVWREKGEVVAQKWLGLTERGKFPSMN